MPTVHMSSFTVKVGLMARLGLTIQMGAGAYPS